MENRGQKILGKHTHNQRKGNAAQEIGKLNPIPRFFGGKELSQHQVKRHNGGDAENRAHERRNHRQGQPPERWVSIIHGKAVPRQDGERIHGYHAVKKPIQLAFDQAVNEV